MGVSKGMPVSKMIGLRFEPKQCAIMVRDPAGVKHFLKDNFDNYTKPSHKENVQFHFLNRWLGAGIFTFQHGIGSPDNGHAWLTQRKIAANIFSKANFQNNMGEVFAQKAQHMCKLLQGVAENGEKVDIQKLFFEFTMDSIMRIFFGEDADTMGGTTCSYGSAYDTAHRGMTAYTRPNLANLYMLAYLPLPFGGFDGIGWRISKALSPHYCEFRRACRILDAESDRLVANCRADPRISERRDLLALFIQSEEKERFSDKYLRDMVLNFVIAGRDTTACPLSWMFYMLSTHPAVQQQLLAEIDTKVPSGAAPTLKQLSASNMPYLNGVLYEALRLYPPVPVDSKTAFGDDVLPDGSKVPKGAMLWFLPYSMGRDPERYPEPEVVRPERWIPFTAPDPYEFPVFQAGPRTCLGMDMSIFEAKVAAVMLLQRYTFKLLPGEEDKIHYSSLITMSICNSKTQNSHHLWLLPSRRA